MRSLRLAIHAFAGVAVLTACREQTEPVAPTDELGTEGAQTFPAFALSPTAVKYTISVTDPINDRSETAFPIDVSKMDLTFDTTTGDYEIVLRTYAGFPFIGAFRININLYNIDAASFFTDVLNDFNVASPVDSILLTGSSADLTTWQLGNRVYTNSLAGTPNPPGVSLFRSSVSDEGLFTSEDVIAFADLAQPATVAAFLSPAEQVGQMLEEVKGLVASGILTRSQANGLLAKLAAIQAKIERGQSGAARNQLGAFGNQAEAFGRAGVLPQNEAQHLLDEAVSAAVQLGSKAADRTLRRDR